MDEAEARWEAEQAGDAAFAMLVAENQAILDSIQSEWVVAANHCLIHLASESVSSRTRRRRRSFAPPSMTTRPTTSARGSSISPMTGRTRVVSF